MKRIFFFSVNGGLLILLTCAVLWAQATAQISGTAKDQSGAVLPGVEIRVTQTETKVTRDTVTNESGSYVLPNLPLGPYRLEASLPGFRTYAQTGIELQVNSSPSVNVVLQVGQVSEQVEVQANAALVETRNSTVGTVVENERILELPLNGRSVSELIALSGAAAPVPTLDGSGGRDPFSKGNVAVSGGLSSGLSYTLDGASHMNPYTNDYMSLPFPDVLQEFKVELGATGAQNGMKSSGSVSLVTKSGTNEMHGDLFEFVRNGSFNARNAFAAKRDTIKRNQFGGTLGGPIAKNKVFFFAGYQGATIRQAPSDLTGIVPTPAMLSGDFTDFASAACNGGRAVTLKAPFVNNRIDPTLISKQAAAFAAKLPKSSDPCGKILFGSPTLENDHTAIGRIDYQLNATHSVFGRYLLDSIRVPPPYDIDPSKNLLISLDTGKTGLAQGFTLGDTHLFGATMVNAVRLTANRIAAAKSHSAYEAAAAGPRDIGIETYADEPHRPSGSITGALNSGALGGLNGPIWGPTRTADFAASDDFSVLHGNHQMAFGVQIRAWWSNSYSQAMGQPGFAFNGQFTGLGMADFFAGHVDQFTIGNATGQNKEQRLLGVYGADTWKVKQRLTLNYGLRWEPYFPILNNDGGPLHFDANALRQGIRTTQFTNAPPGVFFQGDPGFPGPAGLHKKWLEFSPRVGLAWDLAGDGRTSIRASAGTFYDYISALGMQGLVNGSPVVTPKTNLNDVSFDNPWANYPGGDPFPVGHGRSVSRNVPWAPYSSMQSMDYDTPNMQVAQWSLSLQRQAGPDWLLSASYIGNATTHLWSLRQLNPSVFLGLGPCAINGVQYSTCSTTANRDQRRMLALQYPQLGQNYGFIATVDSGGKANYNALMLSFQRRAARGLVLNGNYTWSHCISEPFMYSSNSGFSGQGWTDSFNRRYDRGNCTTSTGTNAGGATDRRHIFNFSAVAETPQFSNRTLRLVGSGWRIAPIFKILSGDYMSLTTNQDRALTAVTGFLNAGQRVNQVLGSPYGNKSPSNYFNAAAFELPALGTLGNSGAGAVAGPGFWQFDTALSRTFQLRETKKLEFRAEAFNLTNSFHMNDPTTTFGSGLFGQVTSAKDPRIMQFALKYVF
jgi:hypothetical protein